MLNTIEQLQNHIDRLKDEYKTRSTAIRSEIADLKGVKAQKIEQGFPYSLEENKISHLEIELERLKNTHTRFLEQDEEKLKTLEAEEAKKQAVLDERRKAQAKKDDERLKAKALIEFRKTGGTDDEFEEQWSEIRKQIRADIVASKMVAASEPSKPSKL
jgi:hypothetical protein